MKVRCNIKRAILQVIILLISMECVLPAVSVEGHSITSDVNIQPVHQKSNVGLFLLKTEKEEQNEEGEKDKTLLIELADFSSLSALLSNAHTKRIDLTSLDEHQFDLHPPLFKLFCIFLI